MQENRVSEREDTNIVNKRKYPRYVPRYLIISSIEEGEDYVVGDIIDISLGGFSFKYVSDIYQKQIKENGKTYLVDLMSPDMELAVEGIECKIVYVKPLSSPGLSFLNVNRCGTMFIVSDEEKAKKIKELIEAAT